MKLEEIKEILRTPIEQDIFQIFQKHFDNPIVTNNMRLDAIQELARYVNVTNGETKWTRFEDQLPLEVGDVHLTTKILFQRKGWATFVTGMYYAVEQDWWLNLSEYDIRKDKYVDWITKSKEDLRTPTHWLVVPQL